MSRNPHCEACALHKGVQSVCVWGEAGSRRADVFLLGEAPGREEDAIGRPFVGQSGKALRGMLEDMKLLERSYITNIVKCRPPENRPPRKAEIKACELYWKEELRKVKPKYVMLLGASAVKALTGQTTIALGQVRGKKNWTYEGAHVIATYHPAAALRTPELWPKIIDDFSRIDSDEFLHPEEIQWKVWDEKSAIPRVCALDIETTGLNPFGLGKNGDAPQILCAAWSSAEGKAVVTENVLELVARLQEGGDKRTLIGHNLKFDLLWLKRLYGYEHKGKVLDTCAMGHLLDENAPSHGLKWWASQLTGLGDYDKEIAAARAKGMEGVEIIDVLRYNAWDAGATWMLYERFLPIIREQGLEKLLVYQGRVTKALVEMESRGVALDHREIKRQSKQLEAACLEIERRFSQYDTNLGSPKQLADLLYGELGLRVVKRTLKGARSTDEEALETLARVLPEADQRKGLVQSLLTYRGHRKMISTYLEGVPKHEGVDGKVHPSFNACGTVTGRFSCSAPNLQNIPRQEGGPKRIFRPEGKDCVFIEADFSQIELRIGAMLSKDEAMLSAFREGRDLHAETAKALWGVTLENSDYQEKRRLAKTINFGIFYGMSAEKFSRETGASVTDGKRFIARWFAAYPGVKGYLQQVEEEVMSRGWVESLFGRRRRLPVSVGDRAEYAHAIRQACNFPVQSSAADLTTMALTLLNEQGFNVRLTVHDSLLLECDLLHVKPTVAQVLDVMAHPETIVEQFGFKVKFPIPILAEAKVGKNWGQMLPCP